MRELVYRWDPVRFAAEALGFTPDEAQARVLDPAIHRGILNCSRQWGKSTVTAVKALHHALFLPESLAIAVSPSERQSAMLVSKVEGFARDLGLRVRGDGLNRISLRFDNGSRIVGLPGNERTTRGFSAVSLLLVDEASRVSDDMYKSVRPFLAAGGGRAGRNSGDLWLMSTPNGKRGFFHEAWANGGERWTRIAVKATECPRIQPEFLAEEREALGDAWFRQEYLCEFVQSENAVFREEDVRACLCDDVPALFGGSRPLR